MVTVDEVRTFAARLPRTTRITRRAVRVARLNMTPGRTLGAVRDTLIAGLSVAGPALLLRSFDGIADWRPPQAPYAAEQTTAGKRWRSTREGRLHRTR